MTPYPEGKFLEVDGIRTHYVTAGSGEPVVLIHGGAPGVCAKVSWWQNVDWLARNGLSVYAFDQPGFGLSDVPSDHSVEARIKHAATFIDQLGLERFHLVGGSLGGYVAVRLALANLRVASLVLIACTPLAGETMPPEFRERLKSYQDFVPTLESVRAMTRVTLFDQSLLTDDLVKLRYEMSSGRRDDANRMRWRAGRPEPIGQHLDKLAPRTLIFWGMQDRTYPVEHATVLGRQLRTSEVHIFNRCGHWPQWDHAVRFNQMVRDFLLIDRERDEMPIPAVAAGR